MDPSAKGNQEYRTRGKKTEVRNETRKNHDGCMCFLVFFFFCKFFFQSSKLFTPMRVSRAGSDLEIQDLGKSVGWCHEARVGWWPIQRCVEASSDKDSRERAG